MQHHAWQRVLVLLSDLNEFSLIEDENTRAAKLQHLQEALDAVLGPVVEWPLAPTSFCESLIHRLKAPQKIAEACCSALGRTSSANSILVKLLATFLWTARMNGALSVRVGGNLGPTKLAAAIDQQFQQAGLHKHLGQVFRDITAQLAAADANPALLVEMQHSPTHKHLDQQQSLRDVLSAAQQALMLYSLLQLLWPYETTPPAAWDPSIDTAVVSLAVTAAQQASKWLDALPASSPEPYTKLQGLLQDAWTAILRCSMRQLMDPAVIAWLSGANDAPRLAQLHSSPQWLAAVCLLGFFGAHAFAEEAEGKVAQAGVPGVGSTAPLCSSKASSSKGNNSKGSSRKGTSTKRRPGSSSSTKGPCCSSTASSSQQQTGAAGSSSAQQGSQWARACADAQQLPPLQQELLQALKCSGKVLLWAALAEPEDVGAHTLMRMNAIATMRGVVEAHRTIVKAYECTACLGPLDETHRQTGVLHTLLPGLVLPWVTTQAKTQQEFVDRCTQAGDLTTSACKAVYQRLYSSPEAQPDTVVVPGSAAEQAGWGLLDIKLQRILPDLVLALEPLLAAARSSSSSSGSSSSSRRQGQPASEEDMAEALWYLVGCFSLPGEPVIRLQVVEPFTWYPEPGSPAAGTGSSALVQHPWQPHAAQVIPLLDSFVRLPHSNQATGACHVSFSEDHELRFVVLARMCAVGDQPQPAVLTATAIAAGLGSTEQQRLFGFLCSLVKRSGMLRLNQQTDAEECRLVAGCVAARFAQLYASSGSTAAAADSANASSCVSGLLPWLVLFGRCCLQWSTQLQWWCKSMASLATAAAAQQQQSRLPPGYIMRRMGIVNCMDIFWKVGHPSLMSLFLAALQTALQHAGICAQLSALGLDAGVLLANVSFAKAAHSQGSEKRPAAVISATKDLGQALTSLPCGTACNNPLCTNLSEASEVQLVQGSHHKCSACRTARYCGKECQAKHWKQHKPVCKALTAAADAAGKGSAAAAVLPAAS